jgi:hypothetical protein
VLNFSQPFLLTVGLFKLSIQVQPSEVLKTSFQGRRYRVCVGGPPSPTPLVSKSQKLLSQSAKLDWLKITTEKNKIDLLNN